MPAPVRSHRSEKVVCYIVRDDHLLVFVHLDHPIEQAGVQDIAPVRRPGTHGAELHLQGVVRGATGAIPVAILIRRDGKDIGRERVTELRGALHHYGPATQGWLITTGQVLSGAREEAAVPGAAPVTLTDGLELARLCEVNRYRRSGNALAIIIGQRHQSIHEEASVA